MSAEPERLTPYPGLRPFEESEHLFFFGRATHTRELIRRLMGSRIAAVVGASGSGKSSLVRAGLVPALRGGMASANRWHIALCRPGLEPVSNLAQALCETFAAAGEPADECLTRTQAALEASGLGLVEYAGQSVGKDENLLVLVDQFEELFALARSGEGDEGLNKATGFVKLLLEAGRQTKVPVYVALTMRSDFLGDSDLFRDLPEVINEGQYLIPRLTRDQCREAVQGPAAMLGAAVAPRLVSRLLNEIGDDSSRLPVFQHVLMRTWDYWAAHTGGGIPLDLEHFEAVGGMDGALSRHADEVFEELPGGERGRVIAERMFKALTTSLEDNREVRRPTTLAELCAVTNASVDEVTHVIEAFRGEGRSFLTPRAGTPLAAESLIDISHESLVRYWRRLREWAQSEEQSRRMYLRLSQTARLFFKGQAALLRDPELSLAAVWREEDQPNEAWARRFGGDYLETMRLIELSLERRREEERAEEMRRRSLTRRTRTTILTLAAGVVISLGLTTFAFRQLEEAQRQRALTLEAQKEAEYQKALADRYAEEAIKARDEMEALMRRTEEARRTEKARTQKTGRAPQR